MATPWRSQQRTFPDHLPYLPNAGRPHPIQPSTPIKCEKIPPGAAPKRTIPVPTVSTARALRPATSYPIWLSPHINSFPPSSMIIPTSTTLSTITTPTSPGRTRRWRLRKGSITENKTTPPSPTGLSTPSNRGQNLRLQTRILHLRPPPSNHRASDQYYKIHPRSIGSVPLAFSTTQRRNNAERASYSKMEIPQICQTSDLQPLKWKGSFLSIVEKVPDHRSSGRKAFEKELLHHRHNLPQPRTLSTQDRKINKDNPSWKIAEYTPPRQMQNRIFSSQLPWAKVSAPYSLQLFNINKTTQQTDSNKWVKAIICDWVSLPLDLEKWPSFCKRMPIQLRFRSPPLRRKKSPFLLSYI